MCRAVLCCTVLYCTVLYCGVLYCTVLYCTVLYCTVLYCTVLWCTVLYCTALHCTVFYYIARCCRLVCGCPIPYHTISHRRYKTDTAYSSPPLLFTALCSLLCCALLLSHPSVSLNDLQNLFHLPSIISKYGEKYGAVIESSSPWVVTFDNFLTDRYSGISVTVDFMAVRRTLLYFSL